MTLDTEKMKKSFNSLPLLITSQTTPISTDDCRYPTADSDNIHLLPIRPVDKCM